MWTGTEKLIKLVMSMMEFVNLYTALFTITGTEKKKKHQQRK